MFCEDPFFEPRDHSVIVWVGSISIDELEDYLDEPGGAADDEPISDFSRDLGRWYDHDYIWAEGTKTPVSVRELCRMNGVEPGTLVDEIDRRCEGREARSLLILWTAEVRPQIGERTFANGELHFVGSWAQPAPLTDNGS